VRRVAFVPAAFEDFTEWSRADSKTYARIIELIKNIQRDPFSGIGKPEPLRHELKGLWSRRIDEKNRLVYKATDEEVIIISCKFHY
jgi:toxin YoeB